jgi:hypothetical protein
LLCDLIKEKLVMKDMHVIAADLWVCAAVQGKQSELLHWRPQLEERKPAPA